MPEPNDAAGALESLAAAFDPCDFVTVLTLAEGRPPRLTLTTRQTAATEGIQIHDGWYWRDGQERVAPTSSPHTAAAIIAQALGRRITAGRQGCWSTGCDTPRGQHEVPAL